MFIKYAHTNWIAFLEIQPKIAEQSRKIKWASALWRTCWPLDMNFDHNCTVQNPTLFHITFLYIRLDWSVWRVHRKQCITCLCWNDRTRNQWQSSSKLFRNSHKSVFKEVCVWMREIVGHFNLFGFAIKKISKHLSDFENQPVPCSMCERSVIKKRLNRVALGARLRIPLFSSLISVTLALVSSLLFYQARGHIHTKTLSMLVGNLKNHQTLFKKGASIQIFNP